MADRLTPAVRSRVMRAVRGRDTGPELLVRRMLHAAGYRFRVQMRIGRKRPDVVFTRRRQVVLIHGCFWHGHDCTRGRLPSANRAFWEAKILRNRSRDEETLATLAADGWRSLVLWECGLADASAVRGHLTAFLGAPRADRGRRARAI